MFDSYGLTNWGMAIVMTTLVVTSIALLTIVTAKTSCVSAKIYNQQNNTQWTCSDFFWASNQINSNSQTIKLK